MALIPLLLKKGYHLAPLKCGNTNILSRSIQTSMPAMAMPLRRKKKQDPAILKAREEKRKKKLERALLKMQKKPRIPK